MNAKSISTENQRSLRLRLQFGLAHQRQPESFALRRQRSVRWILQFRRSQTGVIRGLSSYLNLFRAKYHRLNCFDTTLNEINAQLLPCELWKGVGCESDRYLPMSRTTGNDYRSKIEI